jgi:glucose/arabinose dehydrogenase
VADFVHNLEDPPTEPNAGYDHFSAIREWTAGEPNGSGVALIDQATPSRLVMRIAQPGQFHNGGALAFGHDDYLYISLGDGGNGTSNGRYDGGPNFTANQGHTNPGNPDTPDGYDGHGNAQDRRNVFGSILRIQPTVDEDPDTELTTTANGGFRIPKSNPFTADTNNQQPVLGWQDDWEDVIYAHGFRNPFRINFDRETGELYAADVGQDRNTESREEVSHIVVGGNYGWVIKSGTETTSARAVGFDYEVGDGVELIDPFAQYPTTQTGSGGLAAIGGFVYRGSLVEELVGKYVFGDLNIGSAGSGGRMLYTDTAEPGLNTVFDLEIVGDVNKPSSLLHGVAEDALGEIYYLFNNGQIVKLVAPPVPGVSGDYNEDGVVNAADYIVWRNHENTTFTLPNERPDPRSPGIPNLEDYNFWVSQFGLTEISAHAVPEPAACHLLLLAFIAWLTVANRALRASARLRVWLLPTAFACCSVVTGTLHADSDAMSTVTFEKRKLFVSPHESCDIGDINRDGHLDIVYGPYWFAGPDFLAHTFRANHTSTEYIRANSDHVYDIDGDGWLDVIMGAWGEEGIVWYKNPGNSAAERDTPWEMHRPWQSHVLTRTRGSMEMFALHDYDADGVPEIHSACYRRQEPLEIWRLTNDHGGTPGVEPFVLGREGGGHGFAFGDVNGDGREDVLCEIGWYERPAGNPFAQPWTLHRETDLSKMHPSCPFVVKDLNEDGRLDILFGRGHNYGLFWREQLEPAADGTTRWEQHTIDMSWSQAHCLQFADLDGDGQEDLIAGKCIWAHDAGDPGAAEPPVVYYYTWNRDAAEFTRHRIAGPDEHIALGRQFAVADLNDDGRLDLALPSKTGLWVLINQGVP